MSERNGRYGPSIRYYVTLACGAIAIAGLEAAQSAQHNARQQHIRDQSRYAYACVCVCMYTCRFVFLFFIRPAHEAKV